MHHPKRAACDWPPGGSGGPAAAASRAGSLCCGLMLRCRTRGGRARGRSSSRPQILRPRMRLLVIGSIDRSAAAASRAPWMACATARACVATGVKLSRPWRCSVLAAPAPELSVSAGWKKSGFQQYLGAAIRHCSSCSGVAAMRLSCSAWSRQMQQMRSRSQLTKSRPARQRVIFRRTERVVSRAR